MANPNIVNVTSILGQTTYAALTTTLTTVLLANSASSGNVYKVNSILVSNVNATASADVTLDINTAAGGGGTGYAIASTIAVPADSTLQVIDGNSSFYLLEDKSIVGGASSSNNLEIIISYEQISSS
jgi:hypothetical protein